MFAWVPHHRSGGHCVPSLCDWRADYSQIGFDWARLGQIVFDWARLGDTVNIV